jgi:zinc protease
MARHGIRYITVLIGCIISIHAAALAQNPVQIPELSTKNLLNSLQVIVAPTPYLNDSMAIGLVVRYGSSFDGANKGGLAHLLSRMFMKATVDRTGKELQDELSYLGATLEVQCDWDGFRFLLRSGSETFERSLLLLYQVVCEAEFTEKDLSAVKQELLQETGGLSDPRGRIHDQFEKLLFSGTTYGRPLKGIPEILATLTPGDLRHFYNKYFSPGDASLLVIGNISATQVFQKASRIWGLWVRKDRVPFTFAPSHEPVEDLYLIEDDPGTAAVQFILGNFSPPRPDPSYANAIVATRILQERFKNILPTSLLNVVMEGRRMPGPFYIQGQAAADEAVDQILKIQETLEEFKRTPVSVEELAAAQNHVIEEFNRELKTADGLCRIMSEAELYRLGYNYASDFPGHIRRIDLNAVRQVAKNYFSPGKKILILRGPVQSLMPELQRLGNFKRLLP